MLIYDTPPCKYCKKRFMACHTVCKDYKDWKIDHETRKRDIEDKEKIKNEFIAASIEFSNRYYKKCFKKRK